MYANKPVKLICIGLIDVLCEHAVVLLMHGHLTCVEMAPNVTMFFHMQGITKDYNLSNIVSVLIVMLCYTMSLLEKEITLSTLLQRVNIFATMK